MQPNLLKVKNDPKKEEFRLRISGVESGNYSFSIDCDNRFFELAEIPNLQEGLVKLQIEMEISEKIINLDFHFDGCVMLPCDRCLAPVKVDLNFDEHLLVKLIPLLGETQEEDDMWLVDETAYELDLFHFVYEAITLALPLRIVHPEDENGNSTCDPEILKKLEELTNPTPKEDEIDPRWEALKNIKKS